MESGFAMMGKKGFTFCLSARAKNPQWVARSQDGALSQDAIQSIRRGMAFLSGCELAMHKGKKRTFKCKMN